VAQETLIPRFLPEALYPMGSHHKTEIEAAFQMNSEEGTARLRSSLSGVQVVFLCFTNRVGSNYLTDLLNMTGYGIRVAEEDFNSSTAAAAAQRHAFKSYDSYLDHIVRATKRNDTCIWKIGPAQLLWMANRGFISDFFPDSKYLLLRRRDKLAQAVSLFAANTTGKYISDGSTTDDALKFDKAEIARDLLQCCVGEAHLAYFYALHSIQPYELWYEDMIADPKACVAGISAWLGTREKPWLKLAAMDTGESLIVKQTSKSKDELLSKMRESFDLKLSGKQTVV
jgi:LPS sulfotransferase NodH